MTFWIGADPGVSGGIAILSDSTTDVFKMPETERDLWDSLNGLRAQCIGLLEQLGATPRDKETGQARQSPSSMLKMGRNYGSLRMAFVAAGIPFEEVLPRKWQAEYGLLSKPNESKTDKKNRHKQKAQNLFPSVKVTHATADALLIAEYCRRKYSQQLQAG